MTHNPQWHNPLTSEGPLRVKPTAFHQLRSRAQPRPSISVRAELVCYKYRFAADASDACNYEETQPRALETIARRTNNTRNYAGKFTTRIYFTKCLEASEARTVLYGVYGV
jgi:hypothetical protein